MFWMFAYEIFQLLICFWSFRLEQGLFHWFLSYYIAFSFWQCIFFNHISTHFLSSLSDTFFDRSILLKLNSVLNLWLDRDSSSMTFEFIPYFSLLTLFIFSGDCLIIVTAGILAFCLSDMALNFDILLFSSLIFCSAANAFLQLRLRLVVNIVTLNLSFRSSFLTCWNSLSTCNIVRLFFLLFWTSI